MLKRKEVVEFKIEDTEFGGKAYGHVDGVKVVVKHGIKGQKVKAYISKIGKKYAEGKIMEILEPSPMESLETCAHFGECGGCFQQAIPYEIQLEEKERQVKKLFDEAGIRDYDWLSIEGSPEPYAYRNKMEFSFGDEEKGGPLTLGMHKRGRHHDVVTVNECVIMDKDYRKILTTVLEFFRGRGIPHYNSRKHEGYLRHLVVRKAYYTKQILVNLVTTTQMNIDLTELVEQVKQLDLEGKLVGFIHTFNDKLADTVEDEKVEVLFGQDFFQEEILGLQFRISAFSFFQTNSRGAEVLYNVVRDFVGQVKDQVVFDLYCGTGTIAQIVAQNAKKVIGIEIVEDAVKAAKENAKLNNLDNCVFIAGDVKKKIKELKAIPDMIILDPPRAGIHPKALKDIIDFNAPEIVYVSCNPKTLVRDLVELEENAYKVKRVKCVDMFPHTPHVECVVLMSKK